MFAQHSNLVLALTSSLALILTITHTSAAPTTTPPSFAETEASLARRDDGFPDFARVLGYASHNCSNNPTGDSTLDLDPAAGQFKQDTCYDLATPAQSHRIHFYGPLPQNFSYSIYSVPCSQPVKPADVKNWDYWSLDLKDTTCYSAAPGDRDVLSMCYGKKCRSAGVVGTLKSTLLIQRTGRTAPTGFNWNQADSMNENNGGNGGVS